MRTIDEDKCSFIIKQLIAEAREFLHPMSLFVLEVDNLPLGVAAQTSMEINDKWTIYINSDNHDNNYALSHELLHVIGKKAIPSYVMVLSNDTISMIGAELQGYLEHNWILVEQRRRGLEVDEHKLWDGITESIGQDKGSLRADVKRILILCNLIRTHPKLYKEYKAFFKVNNPRSLNYAQRIMTHYPKKELYSHQEAREVTIKAIRTWQEIFKENKKDPELLLRMIGVTPVFSKSQLKSVAKATIGIIPHAIKDTESSGLNHIIYTLGDKQTGAIFSANISPHEIIEYTGCLTLKELYDKLKLPYLSKDS